MHILYSAALALVLLLTTPWWLWRMLRSGRYRAGLRERLGRVPTRLRPPVPGEAGAIWIHAVSVGEGLAISGLGAELRARFPTHRVFVSTTTDTGQKLAPDRFGSECVFYFPLDFASAIKPYMRALRPELLVLAETEFWPNFLRLAKQSCARIAVVNARISDRSLPRYRRVRALMQRILANVDVFLAQSQEDAQRLVAIGIAAGRVSVAGNLKFDRAQPALPTLVAQVRDALPTDAAVIVCGSTMPGEDEIILRRFAAFQHRGAKPAVLILAPRHPQRFDEVERVAQALGRPLQRRSTWQGSSLTAGVLLLDTIGELAALYSLATIAVVGGS